MIPATLTWITITLKNIIIRLIKFQTMSPYFCVIIVEPDGNIKCSIASIVVKKCLVTKHVISKGTT